MTAVTADCILSSIHTYIRGRDIENSRHSCHSCHTSLPLMTNKQARYLAMRQTFDNYLRQGMPTMLAYMKTGQDFFLSEERVRKILAQNNNWSK